MLGGRVQFSRGFADLVNLSRTGALVRTNYPLGVGGEWPLTLRLTGKSVTTLGRVVRCEPTEVRLPGGAAWRSQFGIAFMFVTVSPDAAKTLGEICGHEVDRGA